MMRRICLLLTAAFLLAVNVFAIDSSGATNRTVLHNFDLVGPAVSFALLGNSSCVTTRTLTATITDIDGVNTNPGTRPRVYYRRNGDIDGYFGNTSATNGWKYAEATNVGSTFTFVIDYSLLNGGVVSGNTVQYFIVAQDLVATPNIGSGGTTFATPPTSVALTTPNFPAVGINIYSIVNALPTYMTVGPLTGDFISFSAAGELFSSINSVGLSGNTIVEVVDPVVTENNANALLPIQNTGCGVGPVTLLIRPAAGVSPTLTGNVGTKPIITILSSNVTIDGSNNGTTSRNMTLQNAAIASNVIIYGSSGTLPTINSTLKNTICINASNTNSAGGVVVCDIATGGAGYFNNITIQNNSIQKSQIGILCTAVATPGNGSALITGNDLNTTSTNQVGLLGIYTEGVDGAVISNNNIGNFESTTTGPRFGIHLNTGSINSTVSGNNISAINYTSTSSALTYGINITTGVLAGNNNITGNTISNITSNAQGATASQQIVYGINVSSASGGIAIRENKISNIKQTSASGYGAYGIGLFSTNTSANITVANNFIFDVAGFGQATVIRNGFGIFLGSGGGYKIYHNSIAMNANQTNTTGISAALMISGVTTAASLDIRNNILANLQISGVPIASRYSIYSANVNTIFSNIDNNDYYVAGTNLGFIGGVRTTLGNIITGFTGNANSINFLPSFVSSTDLHLTTANCGIDNRGTPVGITTDIDAAARDLTTPDMGADEFNSVLSGALAGIAATAVCENKTVSATGTNYVTNACNLIARVLPSGAVPVSGLINTCVTLDATQQYFNGEPYVQRHFDIEPATNAATATATVTLYFTDQEFLDYNTINGAIWPPLPTGALGNADPDRANVRITQFHGTPTGGLPTTTPGNYTGARELIDPVDNDVFWNGSYWEVTIPVNGFSGFYLHTTLYNTSLPIVVNYLTGRRQGGDHLLNWQVTCTATPRATMTLERSADARNYSGIYTITADAARCQQPFDYTDANPLKGMNYYRLKIVDADGHITYSTTVALLNAVTGFDIISIAPNPVVTDNFKLNIASAKAGKMEIAIFDMQGRLVNRQTLSLLAGFNSLPVNVGNVAAGTYTIRANMPGEQAKVLRFVKQ